jgi:hypothetical protein
MAPLPQIGAHITKQETGMVTNSKTPVFKLPGKACVLLSCKKHPGKVSLGVFILLQAVARALL